MDQYEYYIISNEFENFITHCNLNNSNKLKDKSKKSDDNKLTLKSELKRMNEHISNLHMLIFEEIIKNGGETQFTNNLKKEINKFKYE